MRKKIYFLFVMFLLTHCACNQQKEQQKVFDSYAPKVSEAKGTVVSLDSMAPQEIRPVVNVKAIPAGKPIVINTISNVFQAGLPVDVLGGTPQIITPGVGTFILPKVIPVIDHPFKAGMPEVVVAREASVKDNDPDNFSSFKVLQGLKHPLVVCMMQDNTGNLWFGTYSGGVSKYDGKYFTNYTTAQGISEDGIYSILQDKRGIFWFGTSGGGVIRFDGRFFTNYTSAEGLCNNTISDILEDKEGNIWFATKAGVTKYTHPKANQEGTFTNYLAAQGLKNEVAQCLLEDKSGNMWIGTQGGGAFKFNGTSFTNYTTKEGLGNDFVNCMIEDKSGNIWFGTNGSLTKYNGGKFSNYISEDGLFRNNINTLYQDGNSNLWIGTDGSGVIKFNEPAWFSASAATNVDSVNHKPLRASNGTFTQYTSSQGLSNDKVKCIIEDKAGLLWFGTNGGGVCRYDGRLFTHFTTAQGLGNNVVMRTLEDTSGNFWFATWGGGVSKYDGKSFTNYSSLQGLGNNNVFSMLKDKAGNFWFGTGHGVCKFDGHFFTNYAEEQGFSNFQVWSILQDKNGDLWFGTFGDGAYKFDGQQFTHFLTASVLGHGTVISIVEDRKGNILFGNYNGGVSIYDGKSFTYYNTTNGLSNNQVMPMKEDKQGNIWIGTIGGGVNKFDGKTFKQYSTMQGLSNEIVMGILQDNKGDLWFSTRNGLDKMIAPIPNSGKTKSGSQSMFRNYMFADGFLGVNAWVNSIFEDSKGKIWIGTSDRLTCYHPEGEIPDTIAPNIQLSNIALFNENINWLILDKNKDTTFVLGNGVSVGNIEFDSLSKWYNVPGNLSLAYSNNYLTFKYIGITTKGPNKVKYVYKLDGLDENWSAINDRNEAPYGNLPNGSYTFKVKAINSEGYWSPEIHYSFEIRPPWWKTWWFRIVVVFAVTLLLYGIYRYRLNQLMKLQNVRNKIAGDLHDDIGSTLSSINIFTELAKKQAKEVSPLLDQIGEHSQKMLDSMSDIVWTINPENDTFEKIILRMRSFAYDLLGAKDIEFEFNVEESTEKIKLPMTVRKNLYLIFKEATNNMAKYSEATKAFFSISYADRKLKFLIHDNGKGFDLKQDRPDNQLMGGNGMKNMQRRADEIGAQLKVESEKGKGTQIELEWRMK